jgi:hypothetical protein
MTTVSCPSPSPSQRNTGQAIMVACSGSMRVLKLGVLVTYGNLRKKNSRLEPLDLAHDLRTPGRREQVIDPVLAADPVEQHLGVLETEPPGEDLAVVGEHLLWNAMGAHRSREVGTHRAARGLGHQSRTHDEP